jgi:hypothetical protein
VYVTETQLLRTTGIPELINRGTPTGFDPVPPLVCGHSGEQRLGAFKLVPGGTIMPQVPAHRKPGA